MTIAAVPVERLEVAPAIERRPLYFGPPALGLFGWYHAPAPGTQRDLAIAICPPLGHEYVNTHRTLRHLADRLASAGVPALRFDYHGTGDSAGSDEDPHRLSSWIESVHQAARTVRAESGCQSVGLIGLRMGATLAALASPGLDLACLVLWAPCMRGRAYLRELRALQLVTAGGPRAARRSGNLEAGGFLAGGETQADIAHVDLDDTPPRADRILVGARDDLPEGGSARERWIAAGLAVDRIELPGYAGMAVVPHQSVVPDRALSEIVAWVAASSRRPQALRATVASLDRDMSGRHVANCVNELRLADVRESALRFGAHGDLFGIVTEPMGRIDRSAPAIVISNAGSAHHVGPNRLHVLMARRLARAGFRCIRIDLPGLGDSPAGDPADENVPYAPEASATIDAAIGAIASRWQNGAVIVMGLCSGAHTAFHAAVDLDTSAVVESVLINPLTYAYKPGMSLDAPSSQHVSRWQRYRRSIGSLRGWSKLFRPGTDLAKIAGDVLERARIIAARRLRVLRRQHAAAPTELEQHLKRLVGRRRKLTLVFSRFDPGHDLLMINAGPLVKSLKRSGHVRVSIIDGASHTFDQHGPRNELLEILARLLKSRYLPH